MEFRRAIRQMQSAACAAAEGRPGAVYELRAIINTSLEVVEKFDRLQPIGEPLRARLVRRCRDWLDGKHSRQLAEDICNEARWFCERYN